MKYINTRHKWDAAFHKDSFNYSGPTNVSDVAETLTGNPPFGCPANVMECVQTSAKSLISNYAYGEGVFVTITWF